MRYVTELFLVGRRVKQSFKIHTIFEFSLNVQWQKNQESKGFDRVTSNVASKHLDHSTIKSQMTDKIFILTLSHASMILKIQ